LDYFDLLNRKEIEAVDIILPIELNYVVTKDALEKGKHVIVEKPLAANLAQAQEMLSFPQKFDLKMMVAENFRYRPTFDRVKKLLDSETIGTAYAVIWNVFWHIDADNRYAQTKWRIFHQYQGGYITDGGVHYIAALSDLFGKFISGHAFAKSVNQAIGECDTFSLQFKTKSIDGIFNFFLSANGFDESKMIILGNKGTIMIESNKIKIKKRNEPDSEETIADDGGYTGQLENFFQAIRFDKPIISTFEKAFTDLLIILKAYESAATREKVEF
jgi:predicted dehydrogenase